MGVHDELLAEEIALKEKLRLQDLQIESIRAAEARFEAGGDLGELILFWESIWASGGLLFNGSKWTFRLPDLYIKIKEYDKALKIVRKIKNPNYKDKKQSYIDKINKLKNK